MNTFTWTRLHPQLLFSAPCSDCSPVVHCSSSNVICSSQSHAPNWLLTVILCQHFGHFTGLPYCRCKQTASVSTTLELPLNWCRISLMKVNLPWSIGLLSHQTFFWCKLCLMMMNVCMYSVVSVSEHQLLSLSRFVRIWWTAQLYNWTSSVNDAASINRLRERETETALLLDDHTHVFDTVHNLAYQEQGTHRKDSSHNVVSVSARWDTFLVVQKRVLRGKHFSVTPFTTNWLCQASFRQSAQRRSAFLRLTDCRCFLLSQ